LLDFRYVYIPLPLPLQANPGDPIDANPVHVLPLFTTHILMSLYVQSSTRDEILIQIILVVHALWLLKRAFVEGMEIGDNLDGQNI
jgi:hypothetical protein